MRPERVIDLLPLFILLNITLCSAFLQHLPQLIDAVNEARTYYADNYGNVSSAMAVADCRKLYDDSAVRLARLLNDGGVTIGNDDARAWVTGVLDNHRSCLYELQDERGGGRGFAAKLNASIINSLAWLSQSGSMFEGDSHEVSPTEYNMSLELWKLETSKAEFVVSKDGSGSHRTINQALHDLAKRGNNRPGRVVVYVKSGKYHENVEIPRYMRDVMFVGDGMDSTVVTGNRNVVDGSTTYSSATFGVSGDGFWARDMTFENTAGPQKHQAVALRVNSDRSIFYRCSFKAYQDTLFTHSLRQFYRDCQIHGTVDFIFGNAAAVIQNCDIIIRRPMNHQSNMVTAQGRGTAYEKTGISIHNSRILPSPELTPVKGSISTYLGRPWKEYSRTVVWKSDLDGVVDQRGWCEWSGGFALSTLYYAEYMNTGGGASTNGRVKWPGFHVLTRPRDVEPFTVSRFIQGHRWIPASGVPVSVFM